jgi:biopolymer transport protein ExbB
MKPLFDLVARGGPAMIAIIALSVVLYSRCFRLLWVLHRMRTRLVVLRGRFAHEPETLQRIRDELRESFRQQRIALGAMIAAAPLLGLLGTVSGMVKTFESLALRAGEQSMEGLARGISEVLVATESGLLVALPALLFVYLAHRQVLGHIELVNGAQGTLEEGRTG